MSDTTETTIYPIVYTSHTLPLDWIMETEDGTLYIVPTSEGGWRQRRPYQGPREALHPASQPAISVAARMLAKVESTVSEMPRWTCRCGHTWIPRTPQRPAVCPKCKSRDWDRGYRRTPSPQ